MSEGKPRVGWLGAGRMGVPMAERLLAAGYDVAVWNRTPERCEPLVAAGATAATQPGATGGEIVFSMVADDAALDALTGEGGVFAGAAPAVWLECSTVSDDASRRAAEVAAAHGTAYLCAPVSGNPGVVRAGNLLFAVSGPRDAFDRVTPLLAAIGRGAHYVGEAHQARTIKLCTNLMLGVVAQTLAEIQVLAQACGVQRADLMSFVDDSAVGSAFTRYKGRAMVELDFAPTFTPEGQRKDLRLALAQAAEHGVSMPVGTATEHQYTRLVESGLGEDLDFGTLLLLAARDSGLELSAERPS